MIKIIATIKQDKAKYDRDPSMKCVSEDLSNHLDMMRNLLHDALLTPLTTRLFVDSPAALLTEEEIKNSRQFSL